MRINPKVLLGGLRAGLEKAASGLKAARKTTSPQGPSAFVPHAPTTGAPANYAGRFTAAGRPPAPPAVALNSQPGAGIHQGPSDFKWYPPARPPESGAASSPPLHSEGSGPLVRPGRMSPRPSPGPAVMHEPAPDWMTKRADQLPQGYNARPASPQSVIPSASAQSQSGPRWKVHFATARPSGPLPGQAAPTKATAAPEQHAAQPAPAPAAASAQGKQEPAFDLFSTNNPEIMRATKADERSKRVAAANAEWGSLPTDAAKRAKAKVTFGANTVKTFTVDSEQTKEQPPQR